MAGLHQIAAIFDGDADHLASSGTAELSVAEFREDVVRRYNRFLVWARERAPVIPEQATPREVEMMLIASGLPVDQRALGEVVARFEEADYSRHEIGRQRFESMYRACVALMGDHADGDN